MLLFLKLFNDVPESNILMIVFSKDVPVSNFLMILHLFPCCFFLKTSLYLFPESGRP